MRRSTALPLIVCVAEACSEQSVVVEPRSCPDDLTACGDACVDIRVNDANCGGCGVVCGEAVACFGGGCTKPSPLIQPRSRHAAVVRDGRIYVVGGIRMVQNKFIEEVEVYDPRTNRWTTLAASLPRPRAMLSAAVIDDERILAFGGYSELEVESVVHVFSLDVWPEGKSLPAPRAFAASATTNDGRVLAMFGVDGFTVDDPVLEDMAVATLPDASWTTAAVGRGVTPRWGACAARGADGRVYLFGGSISFPPREPPVDCGADVGCVVDDVDIFDPARESWSKGRKMKHPAVVASAALGSDGRIYHVGGGDEHDPLVFVQAYDPGADEWTDVAPLPDARVAPVAVAHPDGRIYVIGGEAFGKPKATVFAFDPRRGRWFH